MVLQEFFNICLMKSLQLFNLCFMLLSPASSNPSNPLLQVISTEFANFKCDEHHLAKLGENVSIACKSDKEITRVRITFYSHHGDSCPNKSVIDTIDGNYTTDNGRILLRNISSVILHIHNVQICDQGTYKICLKTYNGLECLKSYLNVTASYTIDEVWPQNDTTIVCKASGGYPERQLYWFDQNGTNLTRCSKLEATKATDGSFFLSSILQVESHIAEIYYCCSFNSFNSATCSDTRSVWTKPQITSEKLKSEEHTVSWSIPTAIISVLVIVAAVLGYFYKRRKGPNDAY